MHRISSTAYTVAEKTALLSENTAILAARSSIKISEITLRTALRKCQNKLRNEANSSGDMGSGMLKLADRATFLARLRLIKTFREAKRVQNYLKKDEKLHISKKKYIKNR
jgi:hypothetical protein